MSSNLLGISANPKVKKLEIRPTGIWCYACGSHSDDRNESPNYEIRTSVRDHIWNTISLCSDCLLAVLYGFTDIENRKEVVTTFIETLSRERILI